MLSHRTVPGAWAGWAKFYVARDTELDVPVALKTIRPEFAFNDQMLARFKREVLLEREVVHENVCPLYDFSRHLTEGGTEPFTT